jgi:hypothetical protein
MLLQCVVGYITAGWPPSSIYVVENTGVQNSNAQGKLTIQNPFYLNHTTLKRLGVHIIQTPVLLSFSQLQNFFLSMAHDRAWPYYFYSHQDVLVFSFEAGPDLTNRPGDRIWDFYDEEDKKDTMFPPGAGYPGYRTIYENCIRELNRTIHTDKRWALRLFQSDYLTLINRAALDAVGGWDTWIPYYATDCDLNARLAMDGWSSKNRRVGIINDVSSTLVDLAALYRDTRVTPNFIDPNPIPWEKKPEEPQPVPQGEPKEQPSPKEETSEEGAPNQKQKRESEDAEARVGAGAGASSAPTTPGLGLGIHPDDLEYFRSLVSVGDAMGNHKYRDQDNVRNSWQKSQRGGLGEPYYYNAEGVARAFDIITEAGREVYRQKWGHRDCDLVEGTALKLSDMWRVEKDWE